MPVKYYENYSRLKLNEVILLGSHDAGITEGGANAKTQTDSIYEQARCGARFFDVRILAFNNPETKTVSLTTYHDQTKLPLGKKKDVRLLVRNEQEVVGWRKEKNMTLHKIMLGDQGGGLYNILRDAKQFVTEDETRSEFIILKFDKSTNWPQIAKACLEALSGVIFIPGQGEFDGNLNERTLGELAGHVIVLFMEDGITACGIQNPKAYGILEWKNLYGKKNAIPVSYNPKFSGLQYYGKGGVSAGATGTENKIAFNADAQSNLMSGQGKFQTKTGQKGSHTGVNPKVVGLMYWTTTGPSAEGIELRNRKMWNQVNQELLLSTAQVATRMADESGLGDGAETVKKFMPNIVMVDFVTEHKGKVVRELNTKSATAIRQILDQSEVG